MSAQTASSSLDKYGDDDLFSTLLKGACFVGAIFQLICIASSILLPAPLASDTSSEGEGSEDLKHGVGDPLANVRRMHKQRKQEKKKRR